MKPRSSSVRRTVAAQVRERIEHGGERIWRFDDFSDLPFPAVAQALSRLERSHAIQRLSKGTYYHGRPTPFGKSLPSQVAMKGLAARKRPVFPSGLAAASLLGFTTQAAARPEVATSASHLPRKLIGPHTVVHTRRPAAWAGLSDTDAALLDFLRQAGRSSELTPEETSRRVLALLADADRFHRLVAVAPTEPPRVRALIGALGSELGASPHELESLRASLNPLTRFDFGEFKHLASARAWQAKR
jgi:hypothetical protein